MSDDDDLDKFLKEIEEDECLNSTVVAKQDASNTRSVAGGEKKDAKDLETDDVLEEADLFLQELENTEPLRRQMFTETEPTMSSTPILLEKFKSRLDKKSLSASKPKEDSNKDDKKEDDVVKKDSSENGKDEIVRDVVSILGDRSSIMAGNLFSDIDMNDAYLLDEEDDDEQEYAKELTIDQLLELEGLLDGSDDESDSDILEITVVKATDKDETVTEDQVTKTMEGKKVASVQPTEKPADNSTLPPQPPIVEKSKKTEKFDMNVVKNIRFDYYNELKRMYRKYLDCEPPDYNLVREPRIFRDKFSKIIGYEKLDEYLDNNHPMWMEDRKMFAYFIHGKCDNRDIAKFIRDKWNTGLHIDLCQNMTSIPRIKYVERDKESVYIMPVQEEKTFDQTYVYKDVKSALKSMHDTVKNHGTSDAQEKERFDEFNSTIKEDGDKDDDDVVFVMSQKKADGCDYCLDFCLCGSQRTAAKLMEEQNSGRKRKRTNSAGENSSSNKRHHINPPRKILRRDEIVNTIYNQNRHLRMDELAKMVKSAEDVLEFNWCYTQGETMSRQMIQELASLEVVYKGFEYYYSSPYQGYNNKGKGKSESVAKKPETPQSTSKPGGQKDKPVSRPASRTSTGARSTSRSSIDRPGSGCASAADNRPGSSASNGRPGSRASTGRPSSGAGSGRSDSPQVKEGYQGMIEDY